MFETSIRDFLLLTDYYEFSMCNGYFLDGKHEISTTFDYFFRKAPFGGGYAILAGVELFLDVISDFRFTNEDLEYLRKYDLSEDFLSYLGSWKNELTVFGINDGRVVFPNEPILKVKGPLIQCQIIETFLLNCLNFPTLCATKANRMWLSSNKQPILEFGARRAQGPNGAIMATYGSLIGGAVGTSNVLAAKKLGIEGKGTQAHSWIMSYPSEYEAFKKYVEIYPENAILLVDTYDTIKSGVPNAIKIGKELEQKGYKLRGIRLDSGDLTKLSKKSREMLDDAGLDYVKIVVSNDIDEYKMVEILGNGGKIDLWGVGTRLVTAYDQAALSGVYKLVKYDGDPRIKISGSSGKISIPGDKHVVRLIGKKDSSKNGNRFIGDVLWLENELSADTEELPDVMLYDPYDHEIEEKISNLNYGEFEFLFRPLFRDGKRLNSRLTWKDARKNMEKDIDRMNLKYLKLKLLDYYPLYVSNQLHELREQLIQKHGGNPFH